MESHDSRKREIVKLFEIKFHNLRIMNPNVRKFIFVPITDIRKNNILCETKTILYKT